MGVSGVGRADYDIPRQGKRKSHRRFPHAYSAPTRSSRTIRWSHDRRGPTAIPSFADPVKLHWRPVAEPRPAEIAGYLHARNPSAALAVERVLYWHRGSARTLAAASARSGSTYWTRAPPNAASTRTR